MSGQDKNAEKDKNAKMGRRGFLKGVAIGGVAALPLSAEAQTATPAAQPKGAIPAPSPAAEIHEPPEMERLTTEKTGSDFMVDVLKTLNIDYLASNPGATFRAFHESIINYGNNVKPEFITCTHEEAAVAMCHGYAKIAGKPMAAMVHGTVGLQHASMAIYNAYADRVPLIVFTGNIADATKRRPGVETYHSVQDGASLVRDFTKWDDQPGSLQHFGESMVRAYKLTTSVPMAPVLLVADGDIQEAPLEAKEAAALKILKMTANKPPEGEAGAVREAAKMLVAAENPVIIVDRYARTPKAISLLIELAELTQTPVVDLGSRMNFPSMHPLNHTLRYRALTAQADLIFAIEPTDLWGTMHDLRDQLIRTEKQFAKPGVKIISLSSNDLLIKANYQDFQRFNETDLSITGDGEATMPALIEAAKQALDDGRKSTLAARGKKLADLHNQSQARTLEAAAQGWDLSPISTARLCMEIWNQIKNEDWSLVSQMQFVSNWPKRLWNFEKAHHHIGAAGAYGVGYGAPAALGAALANRDQGRITVNIQPDGDLMMSPGVLWTSAHHKIPLLSIMHNNRGYHQEVMHVQRMANRHNRGADRIHIGTRLIEPNIDYAKMAQSMGVWAEGPITDPKDLAPAISRALAVVKTGAPALLDVVTQPR